jgi:hypothetical protein
MKRKTFLACVTISVATSLPMAGAYAKPVAFTQDFPGGFNVSINGGPLTPSGPITVTGIVEDTALDIDPDSSKGEFPLTNVVFNGAGFVDRPVTSPLSLLISSRTEFAFQLRGKYNQGILGWQDFALEPQFVSDVNSLSTLVLPYSRTGGKTYFYQALGANAWNLGGDTIGANLGGDGPSGFFSIRNIPEPATLPLSLAAALLVARRRMRLLRD